MKLISLHPETKDQIQTTTSVIPEAFRVETNHAWIATIDRRGEMQEPLRTQGQNVHKDQHSLEHMLLRQGIRNIS